MAARLPTKKKFNRQPRPFQRTLSRSTSFSHSLSLNLCSPLSLHRFPSTFTSVHARPGLTNRTLRRCPSPCPSSASLRSTVPSRVPRSWSTLLRHSQLDCPPPRLAPARRRLMVLRGSNYLGGTNRRQKRRRSGRRIVPSCQTRLRSCWQKTRNDRFVRCRRRTTRPANR
jgi:hypothetical protein